MKYRVLSQVTDAEVEDAHTNSQMVSLKLMDNNDCVLSLRFEPTYFPQRVGSKVSFFGVLHESEGVLKDTNLIFDAELGEVYMIEECDNKFS